MRLDKPVLKSAPFIRKRLALLLTLALFGCAENAEPSLANNTYSASELATDNIRYAPTAPKYTIRANYNETDHTISGDWSVSFTNNLGESMNKVLFNVWANSPVFGSKVSVQNVLVNGTPAKAHLKDTVLTISDITIKDGAAATVKLTFNLGIPKRKDRFGWSGRQVSLGNWFPILAVHDRHGWNTPPYFELGESFYSVISDLDVTLDAPAELEILATGQQISKNVLENRQTVHFLANNVRDFFVMLNTPFKKMTAKIDNVNVVIAYRKGEEDAAAVMMAAAKQVLPTYQAWFGDYPWQTLTIASADYAADFNGGMEYPTLVTINTLHLPDDDELGLTVAHEIAHQWFYNLVGSNSYREPWLDEALTTFVSYAAFYETTDIDWAKTQANSIAITASADQFADDDGERYSAVIYDDGAKMLSDLHDEIGDELFWQALRQYVDDHRFGIASTADFIRIMQQVSKKNLKPFFESQRVILDDTL